MTKEIKMTGEELRFILEGILNLDKKRGERIFKKLLRELGLI